MRANPKPTFAWVVAGGLLIVAVLVFFPDYERVTATEVAEGQIVFTLPALAVVKRTLFLLFWAGIAFIFFLGCVALLVKAVWSIREWFLDEPRFDFHGWCKPNSYEFLLFPLTLFMLAFLLFGLAQMIHETVNNTVMLTDASFVAVTSRNLRMHREEYRFDEIQSIRTRTKRTSNMRGSGWERRYVDFTMRSGQQQTIQLNDLLCRAWPEIARQASARGIVVEGDF